MAIWKLSHGKTSFDDEQYRWLLQNNFLAVHETTGKNQGINFRDKLKSGDIVCLSRSNALKGLYRVEGDELADFDERPFDEGWLLRKCKAIEVLDSEVTYNGQKKGWTPNYNGTFSKVRDEELELFERLILTPYFKTRLSDLGSEFKALSDTIQCNVQKPLGLNTIFYGPPGTGKTYHTIKAAVQVVEPENNFADWCEVKEQYDRLLEQGRIGFVTFHQSYGYENFIEGLSASTENGQISYDKEPGIFRQLCDRAALKIDIEDDPLEKAIEQFKVDLQEKEPTQLTTVQGKRFLVEYHGRTTFTAFPDESTRVGRAGNNAVSINNIRKLYRDEKAQKIYNPSYTKAILAHLKAKYGIPDFSQAVGNESKQNYVLIIDEINRGNISKTFGELITLIEPSKRLGQSESLEVVLPLSKDLFGVPENLYIIGTMNTADRSLAMIDTALRRRFDFVEMMPELALLRGIEIKGINLESLLKVMNLRIETLYDREHTLGHAFFMPVLAAKDNEEEAMRLLVEVFQNKIIPLLEEYFFEDWHKIRLVLGDNQKDSELCFVRELPNNFDNLFGDGHGLNRYEHEEKRFAILSFSHQLWFEPDSYISIYNAVKEDIQF